MPRSIVAVPLVDERGTIGVLEVLDKRTEATFSIRDVELAGVFARQASVAIRASRVERDVAALIAAVLGGLAGREAPADGVEALVAAAVSDVGGPDDPLWPLVERVAALRRAAPEQLELVTGLLDVLVRQAERDAGGLRGAAGAEARRPRAPARARRAMSEEELSPPGASRSSAPASPTCGARRRSGA